MPKPTAKDRFDAVIRLMEREDLLTNARMTWYLQIQGFIVAAVAIICTKEVDSFGSTPEPAILLLSWVCILISAVVFMSISRARKGKSMARQKWRDWKAYRVPGPSDLPDPGGDVSSWSCFTPGQSVPLIFIVFWSLVSWKAAAALFTSTPWMKWTLLTSPIVIVLILFWALLSLRRSQRFSKVSGVVYDLDGTIIDSLRVHEAAWEHAGERHGVQITPEFLDYQRGRTNEEAARNVLEPLGKLEILDDFVRDKAEYAKEHIGESTYFRDFTVALKWLRRRRIPIWVCTTSPENLCLAVYQAFPELGDLGRCTVWREMYQNGKADGLRVACENMNVAPKECIYVGDAPTDLQAARDAKCLFVGYGNSVIKRCRRAIKRHWELLSLLP